MSTETIKFIRDGEKRVWRWGGGGEEIIYYHYTVTTRMTSALRWAAMRAILMCRNCEGQSHKKVSTDHNFWRERRAKRIRTEAHPLTSLTARPNRLTEGGSVEASLTETITHLFPSQPQSYYSSILIFWLSTVFEQFSACDLLAVRQELMEAELLSTTTFVNGELEQLQQHSNNNKNQ